MASARQPVTDQRPSVHGITGVGIGLRFRNIVVDNKIYAKASLFEHHSSRIVGRIWWENNVSNSEVRRKVMGHRH